MIICCVYSSDYVRTWRRCWWYIPHCG